MREENNALLERCRKVDFSEGYADSMEKNLTVLKSKLDLYEGGINMKEKRKRKPLVYVIAALVAVLSLSAVAFAAVTGWRYLETRILEGEDYVAWVAVREYEDGERDYYIATYYDRQGEPIVIEIDGEERIIRDPGVFGDINEAVSHATFEIPAVPTYVPENLFLVNAVFSVCPVMHLEDPWAGRYLSLLYNLEGGEGGHFERRLYMGIFHEEIPLELSDVWLENHDYMGELEINGNPAILAILGCLEGGSAVMVMQMNIDGAGYNFVTFDITREELIRFAEGLK